MPLYKCFGALEVLKHLKKLILLYIKYLSAKSHRLLY